jgi:predicted GNAT family acetyltransferase
MSEPKPNPAAAQTSADVRHNAAESRYEMDLPHGRAVVEYTSMPGRMIITHTFVPPEFRGRGIAEKIVRFALDDARARHLRIDPVCSYVASFIRRHPDYRPLLDEHTAS